MPWPTRAQWLLGVGLVCYALGCGCAREPVARPEPRPVTGLDDTRATALGREGADEVEDFFGVYRDQGLDAYVARLGMGLAAVSERPDLPWRFRVLDTPVVNAFALPGGFVYLTRGLVAHANSEAALAGVLGHQIAHVNARHAVRQISRLEPPGPSPGAIFFPDARPFGDIVGRAAGWPFLRFGRDAEREADELACGYSLARGYDPREMTALLSTLDRLDGSATGLPFWASTHPAPEGREAMIRRLVSERAVPGELRTAKAELEPRLDGLVLGDDPRQGFQKGRRFYHRELRFQLLLPPGWKARHTRRRVYAAPPQGSAALVLTTAPLDGPTSPELEAQQFFHRHRFRYGTGERFRIGPFATYRAPFSVFTPAGELAGEAGFVLDDTHVHRLLGVTRPDLYRRYASVFQRVIESVDRLRDRRILGVQPVRLTHFELPEPMRFVDALERAGVAPEHHAELGLLNRLEPFDRLSRGERIKVLKRGPP